MKKIILVASAVLAFTAFAKSCDKCRGRGVIEATIQCPLCYGYGNLSPAWFNLAVGNTRWTETTYWTGLQTKSDYRHKMFSFKTCPMCQRSKRPGSITWIHICACPAGESPKVKAACKSARAKAKSKCRQMGVDSEGIDTGDDEYSLNVAAWMTRWQLPPKLYKKLLNEVVNNKFDSEGAHYKRNESKYTEKKFRDDESEDIPKGSRMAKDDSDEKKDE